MFHRSVLALLAGCACVWGGYWEDRTRFFQDEHDMFLGSQLQLNAKEVAVNEVLMAMKNREYLDAFVTINNTFPPARHFFESKSDIDKSGVFKFIQMMPKGGSLHGHDLALVSTEYLIKNLTYRENLYACVDSNNDFAMRFFLQPNTACNWTLVSDMRLQAINADVFDKWLEQKVTLVVPSPREVYPDINAVWSAFQKIFGAVFGLITYRPVLEDYFYQVLSEFHADNVMYVEFRAQFAGVYNLDGSVLSVVEAAQVYENVMKKYRQDNPTFWGGKVIYGPSRQVDNTTVQQYLEEYKAMKLVMPDFMAGFDLVGQEDQGEPISSFIDTLLEFRDDGVLFFFHAGETNWEGTTDFNIIDAILLNTTRIGHGYAVNKHPLALQLIKERGIAIEVNPISNQVLLLVEDLRNHPAASLMADNYPVVIGSDDPSFWGAKGLSYDMYAAFMGLSGLKADLRTLKQLALNSLQYSAMASNEKELAVVEWELQWDTFLNAIINQTSKQSTVVRRSTEIPRRMSEKHPKVLRVASKKAHKTNNDNGIRIDLV